MTPSEVRLRILLDNLQHSSSMLLYNWFPSREYSYIELSSLHNDVHNLCEYIRKEHNFSPYVYKSPNS